MMRDWGSLLASCVPRGCWPRAASARARLQHIQPALNLHTHAYCVRCLVAIVWRANNNAHKKACDAHIADHLTLRASYRICVGLCAWWRTLYENRFRKWGNIVIYLGSTVCSRRGAKVRLYIYICFLCRHVEMVCVVDWLFSVCIRARID